MWSCPSYSCVSSGYGNRVHPISGGIKFYDGIDLAAADGVPILAFGAGTVTRVIYSDQDYGKHLYIDLGGGLTSFYAHCSAIYVQTGATVQAGQKIAAVGTTGSSTGNYLHCGMHKNGQSVNPQNYVKDSDTVFNYTGATSQGKSASKAKNVVKAMFTAYYPANNAMEGGFYDALGNLLAPSKRTMAAPPSIPFGACITIQNTGTSRDGQTYKVNDRSGAGMYDCVVKENNKEKKEQRDLDVWNDIVFFVRQNDYKLRQNGDNSLKVFQLSRKTPAAPRQRWDITAQIRVDAFYCEGVFFIVDIIDMFFWKNNV